MNRNNKKMYTIGLIGSEQDYKSRQPLLIKLYGKNNIDFLACNNSDNADDFYSIVNKTLENSDLIIVGSGAVQNHNLLFYIIKNAGKVFIDIDYSLPAYILQKCKTYQAEAGNLVAFNNAPFLILQSKFSNEIMNPSHINISSIGSDSELYWRAYGYLMFACYFLNFSFAHTYFQILPNHFQKPVAITADIYNFEGKYIHISMGYYSSVLNEYILFSDNDFVKDKFEINDFFNSSDTLKQQLKALLNEQPYSNLNQALIVSDLMSRLLSTAEKQGIFFENK